jgi:DNA polymerase elongation subunit (family B)
MLKTIQLGQLSAEEVNKHLKHPQELEYEKTFFPFILFSKKRYIGIFYYVL